MFSKLPVVVVELVKMETLIHIDNSGITDFSCYCCCCYHETMCGKTVHFSQGEKLEEER